MLKKEFTKSPLKTGFLVLMCPVALYFIVPLCIPKGKAKRPAVAQPLVLPGALTVVNPGQPAPQTESSWQELAEGIQQDRWMATAELGPLTRSPFQLAESFLVVEEEEPVAEEELAENQEEDLAASFVLTATMVGGRTRLATINGRTYREQAYVVLGDEPPQQAPAEDSFKLTEIGARHAVLERQGRQIRLELQSKQSGGIMIVPIRVTEVSH